MKINYPLIAAGTIMIVLVTLFLGSFNEEANGQVAISKAEPEFLSLSIREAQIKTDYITGKRLTTADQREEQTDILTVFIKECYKYTGKKFIIKDNLDCYKTKLNNFNRGAN